MDRRNFLSLAAIGGGAVFAAGLPGCTSLGGEGNDSSADFYFVQLSDAHWGYEGPDNPDAAVTLGKAVATVNALEAPPDFIVFTRDGTVIEIEARRFKFTPNEISVKRGELVTLAFRSVDFVHGFHLADLGVRADLMPGQVTKVRLQPMRNGKFTFNCDNFCGTGHEDMNGTLIVEA